MPRTETPFPETKLLNLAERYEFAARDLQANGKASPLSEQFADYALTMRQAVDAQDALRDLYFAAKARIAELELLVSPPALAGEEPT